jgi:hypothetical protein
MIPADDDVQPLLEWHEAGGQGRVWTPYLALISGLYQENQDAPSFDYGTATVELAIELINDPSRWNKPVWRHDPD